MQSKSKQRRRVSPHTKQRKTSGKTLGNSRSPKVSTCEDGNSPHLVRKRLPPKRTGQDYGETVTNFDKYMMVFNAAPDKFWDAVMGIRSTARQIVADRGMKLVDTTISFIPSNLREALPNPLSKKSKKVFIEAVRTHGKNGFPKHREKQAKFLAESLATDGKTSARTSRDICLKFHLRDTTPQSLLDSDHSFVSADDSNSILS